MILVIENDEEVSHSLRRAIRELGSVFHTVTNFTHVDVDEATKLFSTYETIACEPNEVESSQYNLMMMLMYHLMNEDKLAVKKIYFCTSSDRLVQELQAVWKFRKYLDKVLEQVTLYQVSYEGINEIKI